MDQKAAWEILMNKLSEQRRMAHRSYRSDPGFLYMLTKRSTGLFSLCLMSLVHLDCRDVGGATKNKQTLVSILALGSPALTLTIKEKSRIMVIVGHIEGPNRNTDKLTKVRHASALMTSE